MALAITNNSPSPGYVAWAGLIIKLKDTPYEINNGNSNKKYLWWDATSPTELQETDSEPTLTIDDCIVIYNVGGIAYFAPNMTLIRGELIYDGSINTVKCDGTLKGNEIICMAAGFNINGSSATLVDTAGTAAKCYAQHISATKTYWFDFPKFRVPDDYDGGDIDISVAFRCAAASKKHSLGIRVASVADGEPHNPDLAAAYQLYNEESSDATIGDVTIKTVTVTQANHLMVAGEIWHCKFVVEDDAECDADAVLIDFVRILWNKV